MKKSTIPITAPTTTLDAYGRVLDLATAVNAIRTAALSELHELSLPRLAGVKLTDAHQALLAAHREIEAALLSQKDK